MRERRVVGADREGRHKGEEKVVVRGAAIKLT